MTRRESILIIIKAALAALLIGGAAAFRPLRRAIEDAERFGPREP
jgi:hypothetical protein